MKKFNIANSWKLLRRSYKQSFESNHIDEPNNDITEVKYCCQACFYSDLVESNPIVFCEGCDAGVHQRCYGISDLEASFYCQKCLDKQAD
jgi:GMP synthase PP-ATPase subunit